jgi:hypothetical protein
MNKCLLKFVEQLEAAELTAPLGESGPDNLFSTLVNRELQKHVGAVGLQQARQAVSQYFRAVQLCRENNMAAAHAHLQQCDGLLCELPAAALDFVRLFQLGAWSNYYYKAQQSLRAIELLREGFLISAALERQGYPAFLYWRIGQLFNITTVLFREKSYDEGHYLLKNAVVFTYSGYATDLIIDDWSAQAIHTVPTLQENALDQLFGQVARQNIALMKHETYNEAYYYHFFFKPLLLDMETETYNRMVLYNWMHAKVSYIEEGLSDFLDNALNFVISSDVTQEFNIFKINLLAQVRSHILHYLPADTMLANRLQLFADENFMDRQGKAIRIT